MGCLPGTSTRWGLDGCCRVGCGGGGAEPPQPAVSAGRFLRSELLGTRYGALYMPSTGALMLLTALHACDRVRARGAAFPLGTWDPRGCWGGQLAAVGVPPGRAVSLRGPPCPWRGGGGPWTTRGQP